MDVDNEEVQSSQHNKNIIKDGRRLMANLSLSDAASDHFS